MARRRLLGDAFWAGVFALPSEEREVVRHCTLTPDDLALVAAKRGPHNRLAYALLLLALRHPGRALEAGEVPPTPMVAYVARQIGADPAVLDARPARRPGGSNWPSSCAAAGFGASAGRRRAPWASGSPPSRGPGGCRPSLRRRWSRNCGGGGSCCPRRACWTC
jgi:hypothetical protein